jgi:hypothetical protein
MKPMLTPAYLSICHAESALPEVCRNLVRTIQDLRTRLQKSYERRFPGQSARIRHAIKEAEALAWSTSYPHLFLPDLAEIEVTRLVSQPKRQPLELEFAQAA